MNAPYHPPAGISPRASLPAASPTLGRREPHHDDVRRATELVDAALEGASQSYIDAHRERLIRQETKFARFEREQKEFRRRHGLDRVRIGRKA